MLDTFIAHYEQIIDLQRILLCCVLFGSPNGINSEYAMDDQDRTCYENA